MQNALITTHKLNFESGESHSLIFGNTKRFRVGSCEGQWTSTSDCYVIISVINKIPGNGHLNDVFEWFEHSSHRDGKNLLVVECLNKMFYLHLISKRGFVPLDLEGKNAIKVFNKKAYRHLKKKGNEIIKAGTMKCI